MKKLNLLSLKLIIPFLPLLLWSCGKTNGLRKSENASRPEVTPSAMIGDSFKVESVFGKVGKPSASAGNIALAKNNQIKISINKNALEKEFLLQAQLIQSGPVPMFNGLKSRVVAFRKRADRIYLLEATQGHAVDLDIPQNLLITDFAVLEEKGDWITFDFNEGLSRIFVSSDWRSQDLEGGEYKPDFKYLQTNISYLEAAQLDKKNQLYIDQVAQVAVAEENETSANPVEVRYYLSTYQPNPGFETVKSKDFDIMGFFEVAPKLNSDSGSVVHAAKFDIAKPVVYAISANTPSQYKEAIKDGILYWNKAMGHDVLQVIDAPAGINAPNMDYNIVQWVNWDNAGWAYADSQMDPRSGEILHTQVFLPSAFGFFSKFRARQIYHFLKTEEAKSGTSGKHGLKKIFLKGMFAPSLCQRNMGGPGLEGTLLTLLEQEKDDSKFLKASQDYIREVVAHEVGHTLGLRHNFAGSLAGNYTFADREKLLAKYFQEGETPTGVVTTSSVMEYEDFSESMLSGDQVKKVMHALSYDEKSIQTLYYGAKYKRQEVPLFCTDSHTEVARFMDCITGDIGSSPVEYLKWKTQAALDNLPKRILEEYIWAKSGALGVDPTPLEKVSLSPKDLAFTILEPRFAFIQGMTSEGRLLSVQRQYPFVGPINQLEVREAEMNELMRLTEKAGGIQEVLKSVPANLAEEGYLRFVALLDSGKFDAGTGPGDKAYTFSEDDKMIMKKMAQMFYKKLQAMLVQKDLEILSGALHPTEQLLVTAGKRPTQEESKLEDHPLVNAFTDLINERAKEYALSTTEEFIEGAITVTDGDHTKTVQVKLPKFRHPFEQRVLASGLLKKERSKVLNWGFRYRAQLSNQLKELMSKALGGAALDNINLNDQPDQVVRWILENQAIMKAWAWE